MDQSNRYADLSLDEDTLIAEGRHILVTYTMTPAEGYGYLSTAAHFAAESSTGSNVEVSTTDDFTKDLDAMVYEIDEANGIMKIAYPNDLFDRNIIDGRAMVVSFLTLAIGNNQGMGDVKCAQMQDFWVPKSMLDIFDGPSKDITDLWNLLGRSRTDGGYIAGTIIKPKLGLRPEPFAKAAYQFWLGGDFIKNDEPQGNQVYARIKEELKIEKNNIIAFDSGYIRSKTAILDANITTLISAIILFFLGSGPIKGFSITLGVGIFTTLFSVYFIARLLTSIYVIKNKNKEKLI